MWPWEHLAVGYILYALLVRIHGDSRIDGPAAAAVAFGTQFPDLVDKPLAWWLGILPSGVSLAHSVFTATLLSAVAILVARRYGRGDVGVAYAVGYLSHLPADMLYPLLLGEDLLLRAFAWPLWVVESSASRGLFENFSYYLVRFLLFLTTPRGMLYLSAELALLGLALVLWIADGCPVVAELRRASRTAAE